MESTIDGMLVRDVARAVVARVAPEELPAFRVVSNDYFSGSRRAAKGDNGLLDFGPGEAIALLTPVALAAANEVTQHLISEFIKKSLSKSGKAAARAVRRLFGVRQADGEEEPGAVRLSEEEWTRVRQIVADVAARHGLPPEQVARLVDGVVAAGQDEPEPDE